MSFAFFCWLIGILVASQVAGYYVRKHMGRNAGLAVSLALIGFAMYLSLVVRIFG